MENWKFAINSIMGHKMRSFLTTLGIIIGVASVVLIMALGRGLKVGIDRQVSEVQKNLLVYFKSEATQKAEEDPTYIPTLADTDVKEPTIKEEWVAQVAKETSGISGYYTQNGNNANIAYGKKTSDSVTITGVNKTYFSVKKVKIKAGRSFKESDYQQFGRIIMINTLLAQKLFGNNDDAINKVVSVGDKRYLIVGVYKSDNNGLGSDQAIMTNSQVAIEFNVAENAQIYFHLTDVKKANQVGKIAGERLTKLSQTKDGIYENYNLDDEIQQANQMANMMTIAFGIIAGISLLVGGIGVMNIMLVSVTERTREIGLRKALGATRGKILFQFLIESIVLTVLGGLFGLGLACIGVSLISPAVKSLYIYPEVSLNIVVISVLFSSVIGVIFGVLPANRASKLNPIEALRYE